jgi:transcription antitermination factor NusG
MAEIEKNWYVLRTISGKEANVKEYIELDMKNHDSISHNYDRKETKTTLC